MEIIAWYSSLSGLEKIYVDGVLLSKQNNLSTVSTISFSIGDNQYSTNLKPVDMFKGPYVCTLIKNGTEYRRQKFTFPKVQPESNKHQRNWKLLLNLVLGTSFGFAYAHWKLPVISIFLFSATIFISVFILAFYKNIKNAAFVEDEIIV